MAGPTQNLPPFPYRVGNAINQTGNYLGQIPGAAVATGKQALNAVGDAGIGVLNAVGNFGLGLSGLPMLPGTGESAAAPVIPPVTAAIPRTGGATGSWGTAPEAPAVAPVAPVAAVPQVSTLAPAPAYAQAWNPNDSEVQAGIDALGPNAARLAGGAVAFGGMMRPADAGDAVVQMGSQEQGHDVGPQFSNAVRPAFTAGSIVIPGQSDPLIQPGQVQAAPGSSALTSTPDFEKALAAEGVTGQAADFARSVYHQESGSGANTATSNAGAVGGMQITPGTFKEVADKGWDIANPEHNSRAGIRYANQMFSAAGGNPVLAGAGYYGGPGGLSKAASGVAVSDPRNPNAPSTLGYGQQVASRMGGPTAGLPAMMAVNNRGGDLVQMIKGGESYYTRPDGNDLQLYPTANGLSEMSQGQRAAAYPAIVGHQMQLQGQQIAAGASNYSADQIAAAHAAEDATKRYELGTGSVQVGTIPGSFNGVPMALPTFAGRPAQVGGAPVPYTQGPTGPAVPPKGTKGTVNGKPATSNGQRLVLD